MTTLNHLATGFGLEFLAPRGAYAWTAAAFAVCVSVSITGLFLRRFVARPKWLGGISPESGVIAGLILTLMLTFLGAFYLGPESAAAKPLWWAHTLALAVFLPLIPHTKHLHLLLSPITVFLSRGSFVHIPPLNGDEDFGLDTGKDLTQIAALQAYSCGSECGRCTEHCPAANTGKVLDPKQIALGFRGLPQRIRTRRGAAFARHPLVPGSRLSNALPCGKACEFPNVRSASNMFP